MTHDDVGVGYGRPPRSTQFKKGRSGNPSGRPKGRSARLPYEAILGRTVTIVEDGQRRAVKAEEAFLKMLLKESLSGKDAAALDMLDLLERARAARPPPPHRFKIIFKSVAPGSVSGAAEILRIGRKLDRRRETAKLKLEPWIVEAALARFGEKRLSEEDQRKVVGLTRRPHTVRWPDWWAVKPRSHGGK